MTKNFLEINNVTFAASAQSKVNNVSLTIENQGDIVCLLGPSGIGKTTILRTIAGLEKVQSGKITLKNKILSSDNIHIEPENRNISMGFQDNSLFPHYTVLENIKFGADRNKKKKKGLNLNEINKLLHIEHIVNKYPHQISSGEAQRASLARSLLSNPDLLLLDEPLSNVDQNFKEEIQVKLKQILIEHKITTIIVTHDSYEAFYLGTKCGIILDGQLKQYDDPYNVYHFPNSIEVVNFLNRGILIPAKVTGENSLENDDLGTITGDFIKHYPKGSEVQLLLQPEDLEHDDKSNLKLEVVDRKFRGTNFIYTLKTASNRLEINNVTFAASAQSKVNNVSLTIENQGDIVCLLGPSGIGKTTILRTIAGLEKVQSGKITLKNKILSSDNIHIEPENRNISMGFQDNSLFPHYTVLENIKFGADRNKKKKKGLNLNEINKLLHIEHIVNKYPHQISSGEAQRASLARSLLSNPDLLLLDEPLSNVDQNFKEEIQVKLKQILIEHKITTIIVTHDSYEAFYLGTKCGIILDGQLKQYDDPYNVYHFPNSIEVVNFLNRGILIPAKVTGENSLENDDLGTITGDFIKHYPKGSEVQLLLQPEDLEHDDKSNLKLEVVDRKFRGTNFIYTLKTASNKLIPVFVHSHHIHQHEVDEKFGIKRPINIDHIVCF